MTLPLCFRENAKLALGLTCGNWFTDNMATQLDVTTAGTVEASKALVCDANKDLASLRNLTVSSVATCGSVKLEDTHLYPVNFTEYRVWDAPTSNPVATGANDDLALIVNTPLTSAPTIESGDSKAATTSRRIGFFFTLPENYTAADTIVCRINAGMKTTVSDTTATVDLELVRLAAPSTDICATAAQSINSLTAANKDFTITATNVVPGDQFYGRVSIDIVDGATGTAVIGQINSVVFRIG